MCCGVVWCVVNRMNFVSQISAAIYVYPGACHSRFIHSLGVMNIAGKYMKHLLQTVHPLIDNTSINEKKWIQIARLAALLHDIGHGPYSHSFDRIVYSKIYGIDDGGHDVHRVHLIKTSPLKECIENCGVKVEDIIKVWNAKVENNVDDKDKENALYYICNLIVGGPLGSDRIDFILRDSYFTGTSHLGTIAWKRIIYNSKIMCVDGVYTVCYAYKTLQDIIQALEGRRYMYNAVYLHKKVDAASILVEKMMENVMKEMDIDVYDVKQFIRLDDNFVIGRAMMMENNNPSRYWIDRFKSCDLPVCLKEEIVSR